MKNELIKLSSIIEDKDRDIEGLHEQLNASLVGKSTDFASDIEAVAATTPTPLGNQAAETTLANSASSSSTRAQHRPNPSTLDTKDTPGYWYSNVIILSILLFILLTLYHFKCYLIL